jgi:hypothetical protein
MVTFTRIVWKLILPVTCIILMNTAHASAGGNLARKDYNSYVGAYRGAGDTIRTIPAPDSFIMGIEWIRDTLYVLRQADFYTQAATLYKLDPADGSVLAQFTLPFTGYVLGITCDGNNLWIVQWAPDTVIFKITPSGTFLDTLAFPQDLFAPRGIAWDGEYLWVGDASTQTLYKVDTLGVLWESISMIGIIGWSMGMVWVPEHTNGHLWINDDDYVSINDDINQLNITGGAAYLIQDFLHPAPGDIIPEGICHDGEHLWVSEYHSDILWQIDDGIVEGIEQNISVPQTVSTSIRNYPNPCRVSTTLNYSLAYDDHIELVIYNVQGQLVRSLLNSKASFGEHTIVWDGLDNQGKFVPNGVYFCRLKTARGDSKTRQMIVTR